MAFNLVDRKFWPGLVLAATFLLCSTAAVAQQSVARQWNEQLLEAIRHDLARPTVHARNLFHVSAAMWDAWAAYDSVADGWLVREKLTADDIQAARREAISHAAYRLLSWRFANSPGAAVSLASFTTRMQLLGYDPADLGTAGDSPAALGNRIAAAYISFGLSDGANEANGYANRHYTSVNPPLIPPLPGNPEIIDPNRYQPLALEFFIDQGGNVIPGGFPEFLSPEWGQVVPFSLGPQDLTIHTRDGFDYWLFHDPGPPPQIGSPSGTAYQASFEQVVRWSGLLDPTVGTTIDISPASRGNNTLGTNDGHGYALNPVTGLPYVPEIVPAGDYYRVLAEFWADGPASETPPGHWFTIANGVSDHPLTVKRLGGEGPVLDDLEWDVKLYLALGGAMHDVAVSSWGVKGWYDFIRPISAIRYMADLGQSTDPNLPSYNPDGIHLYPGEIELLTPESIAPGERHAHLAGPGNSNLGKIAVFAWRGPDYIANPATDTAGVGWILAENWWPYQRPTFVTPPFAGYVSGHSTYSRAAATVMAGFTGDEFFPGGLAEFEAPQNEFLVFEEGPSVDITLQWAKYADAADECSLSRIYGGIHPPADDIPGRLMGAAIGPEALDRAIRHFQGTAPPSVGVPAPVRELPSRSAVSLLVLFSGMILLGLWAVRRRRCMDGASATERSSARL
ncbi:vanadium-dependent haloperoxidase [Dokdonella sp.]|uniref:vanadium-dependent haloperoxidase n=1 Tax=Dokdonella sp. TaxID=2291710 RepID=UPI0035283C5C